MRFAACLALAAPLALVAALTGCPYVPQPPTPEGPPPVDCATRPPATVVLAASNDGSHSLPVDGGLFVHSGVQGGYHVWMSVHTENLGPDVVMTLQVKDETGMVVSEDPLYESDYLPDYEDPDGGGATVITTGILALDDPTVLFGKEVTISAKVEDACPHSASATAHGVVKGWDVDGN